MASFCAQQRLKWGGPTCFQRPSVLLRSFSATGPLQGPQMDPKWIQNGAKMIPNWTQNGTKMEEFLKPNPPKMKTKSNEAWIQTSVKFLMLLSAPWGPRDPRDPKELQGDPRDPCKGFPGAHRFFLAIFFFIIFGGAAFLPGWQAPVCL